MRRTVTGKVDMGQHQPGDFRVFSWANRRAFLRAMGAGLAGGALRPAFGHAAAGKKLKVAAVITEFWYRSHAHVILENFLEPYLFNGKKTESGCEIISFYVDHFPDNDMARGVAKAYNIPIFPTIEGALTLGGKGLEAEGVLSIAEHGKYPKNAKGQIEYPRKRFFDEIAATFEKTGQVAPVFNDKHLSYRWDWAKEMYDTSVAMKIPFLAGSSVPLAQRRPPLEVPEGSEITAAVSIHGGPLESYDFHGLEVLQSIVEARKGGETGLSSVQFLEGDALFAAADAGLWSTKVADAAMAAELGPGQPPFRELMKTDAFSGKAVHGILLAYKDGLRAAVLGVGSLGTRWNLGVLCEGDAAPRATAFYVGPWDNRNLFKALSHAIQAEFHSGVTPYPIERTLMTTGALDAAMDSRLNGNKVFPTPHLEFAYKPTDWASMREMGETWKVITPDTVQPKGIDDTGKRLGS